jgi:hypothetical protein
VVSVISSAAFWAVEVIKVRQCALFCMESLSMAYFTCGACCVLHQVLTLRSPPQLEPTIHECEPQSGLSLTDNLSLMHQAKVRPLITASCLPRSPPVCVRRRTAQVICGAYILYYALKMCALKITL